WRSDGTAAGTFMVKDIHPGSSHGFPNGSYPRHLPAVGGAVFFSATDPTHRGLWKSDRTAARTGPVAPDSGAPLPNRPADGGGNHLTDVGGTLFFSAFDPVHGTELWRSDGTAAGTVLVKDIRPGTSPYGYPYGSRPSDLAFVNGALFFSADDGQNGREPWILT